jgi:hypothetical protein
MILVERMAGHRTRLAQQASTQWHLDEDQQLHQYYQLSARGGSHQLVFEYPGHTRLDGDSDPATCVGWIWTHPTLDVAQFSLQVGGLLLALQACLTTFGGGVRSLIRCPHSLATTCPDSRRPHVPQCPSQN